VAELKSGQGRWKHPPASANVIPSAARDLLFLHACPAAAGLPLHLFGGRSFSSDINAHPHSNLSSRPKRPVFSAARERECWPRSGGICCFFTPAPLPHPPPPISI
jgi:hypothetical protein